MHPGTVGIFTTQPSQTSLYRLSYRLIQFSSNTSPGCRCGGILRSWSPPLSPREKSTIGTYKRNLEREHGGGAKGQAGQKKIFIALPLNGAIELFTPLTHLPLQFNFSVFMSALRAFFWTVEGQAKFFTIHIIVFCVSEMLHAFSSRSSRQSPDFGKTVN